VSRKEWKKEKLRNISSDESRSSQQSSNFSYFDSEASRVDFWKDINTKDSDYKNAVIVQKSGGAKSNVSGPAQET